MLTTGVPVTVKPVTVAVVQSVPPAALQTMLPVPKARVLAVVIDEENKPVVSVFPLRSNAPPLKVKVLVAPTVMLSRSCTEPDPEVVTVIGKSKVFRFVVINCVAVVPKNLMADADAVSVIPVESFKLPYMMPVEVAPHVPANPVKSMFFAE
jgi:hypothetical protein